MKEVQKKFFNLLAYIKYIIESKASIPFPESENTRPYKKPYGFNLYEDKEERIYFENMKFQEKEDVIKRVKEFHFFRRKFEERSKSVLNLSSTNGGQITLNLTILTILVKMLDSKGVKVSYRKNKNVVYSEKKPLFGFIKLFKNKDIAEHYTVTIKHVDSSIIVDILAYYLDGKISFISFIENSVEERNGDALLKKLEKTIKDNAELIYIDEAF